MFQMKERNKTPELSEVEIGSLLEKEFRAMTVKMIQDLRRMDSQTEKIEENFNKEKIWKTKKMR